MKVLTELTQYLIAIIHEHDDNVSGLREQIICNHSTENKIHNDDPVGVNYLEWHQFMFLNTSFVPFSLYLEIRQIKIYPSYLTFLEFL
jgi:hypothetical protein